MTKKLKFTINKPVFSIFLQNKLTQDFTRDKLKDIFNIYIYLWFCIYE